MKQVKTNKHPGGSSAKGKPYYRPDILVETWMIMKQYRRKFGVMPTYRWIALAFETGVGTIQHRIRAMEREGLIRRIPGRAGGFVIRPLPKRYKTIERSDNGRG